MNGRWISMLGGLALVVGSFLEWIELGLAVGLTRTGFDLELPVYVNWDEVGLADTFLLSAGMVTALLGALVVLGALTARMPLVRLAGFIAVAAALLLWISLANTNDMRIGYWVVTAGSMVATVGGFLSPDRAPAS